MGALREKWENANIAVFAVACINIILGQIYAVVVQLAGESLVMPVSIVFAVVGISLFVFNIFLLVKCEIFRRRYYKEYDRWCGRK